MKKRLFALLARVVLGLLLSATIAAAQAAVVTRNVNLRIDASSEQPPVDLLKPPLVLEVLAAEEDGCVKVRTPEGLEGFVWSRNIRIETTPAAPAAAAFAAKTATVVTSISETWDKLTPNKSSFTGPSGNCGFGGVGAETASNQRKNRTDSLPATVHDVTFKALADFPVPVGPKNRSKWISDQPTLLAEIAKFEGVAVRVIGFLVAVKLQTGSSEGTNCRFTTAGETDWHLALAEKAGQGEEDAVVIETTSRIRKNHAK